MRYAPANTGSPALQGIQALRAAAALAVVAYHATDWPNGAAGVDIFFVVSGFVMVVSSSQHAGQARPGWRFFTARLGRIVPLYWLCSLAKIGIAAMGSSLVRHTRLSLSYCLESLLFLPVHDAAGRFRPVLSVGWTLSFEMLFYGLFAIALGWRLSPGAVVPPILLAIALLPHEAGSVPGEMCNPIVVEFAYGCAAGLLWLRGWRLSASWACPAFCVSAACLLFLPKTLLIGRFISWGLPATGLVVSMVSLEARLATRLPASVLALGDASYAIYLTHGFVLPAVAAIAARAPSPGRMPGLEAGLAIMLSAAFGWIVHITIEQGFLGMRGRAEKARRAPVVAVLAGGGLQPLSGGVGILLRNLMAVWRELPQAPHIRLIDTRGAGGPVAAAFHFARSLCLLLALGLTGRVGLVHAHMTTRGSALRKTLLCAASMCLRIPVIVHMHGADFLPFYRRLHPALQWPMLIVLRRARHVVVLGHAWRQFLIHDLGLSPARVSIVPNGVPAAAPAPRRLGEMPHILFLGRLCVRKGVPELIDALASPAVRALPWRATLAGDGDAAPFRAMLGRHNLANRVSTPGWVGRAEIAALLAQADMLVLPSHHEAMPISVLEALAAAVPVIATPVGTLPEFLRGDVNALLVTPGSVPDLAAAILRLLQDATLRCDLAARGLDTFRERLDIGFVASRMAELYRLAMNEPATPLLPVPQAAE